MNFDHLAITFVNFFRYKHLLAEYLSPSAVCAEEAPDEKLKINKLGPNIYKKGKILTNEKRCRDGMPKLHKQGKEDIKVKLNIQSRMHPYRHVFHKRVSFLVYLRSSFWLSIACIARPSHSYTASLSIL